MAARVLAPHVAALATVVALQIVLPSTIVPRYSGTSVRNVWRFRRDHVDHLAEVSGFKRSWQDTPDVLGSTGLGWVAVVAYFTAAVGGIVLAFLVYRRRDLHLVAYAAGALLIGGSFRSPINRYVCTIAPILLLIGAGAVAAGLRRTPWRHAATVGVSLLLGTLATANVLQADTRIDNARLAADQGAIEWGPTHPQAIQMFDAVIELSEPTDVIAAPKARAMTLETDRPAIQVDEYRPIPETVPLGLIVVERSSSFADEVATAVPAYREVWANDRFMIYEPPLTTP